MVSYKCVTILFYIQSTTHRRRDPGFPGASAGPRVQPQPLGGRSGPGGRAPGCPSPAREARQRASSPRPAAGAAPGRDPASPAERPPRGPQGAARRRPAGLNRQRRRAQLAPRRGPASRARAHRPLRSPPRPAPRRAARTGTRRPVTCRSAAGRGRGSWLRSPLRPRLTQATRASPVRLRPLHPRSSGVRSLRHHRDGSGSRTERQPAALRRHHRGARTRNRARAAGRVTLRPAPS